MQQWTSCASRGTANLRSNKRGVAGTEVVLGQWISSESGGAETWESLKQDSPATIAIKVLVKKKQCCVSASNDHGSYVDEQQPKIQLTSPRN